MWCCWGCCVGCRGVVAEGRAGGTAERGGSGGSRWPGGAGRRVLSGRVRRARAARQVVSINGQDTTGWSGDHAASVLRGQGGSEVSTPWASASCRAARLAPGCDMAERVRCAHCAPAGAPEAGAAHRGHPRRAQPPRAQRAAAAARRHARECARLSARPALLRLLQLYASRLHAAHALCPLGGSQDVSLQREAVAISPLFAHVLTAPSTGGDTIAPTAPSAAKAATAATTARQVGYLRLSQFSGNAASEMRRAVTDLKVRACGAHASTRVCLPVLEVWQRVKARNTRPPHLLFAGPGRQGLHPGPALQPGRPGACRRGRGGALARRQPNRLHGEPRSRLRAPPLSALPAARLWCS